MLEENGYVILSYIQINGVDMEFERHYHKSEKLYIEYLNVYGTVHFDCNECFCGRSWVLLTASKGDDWHKPYTITVTICDQDDYDIGQIYYCREENFTQVLRELINWMNDLEYGMCFYDEFIVDVENFFPDCGCRKEWR